MRNRTALTLLLGLIFGISGAAYVSNKEKKLRNPSSVEEKKKPWMPAPIGKHLALLKVEIQQPENLPDEGNDEVTVVGRILVTQDLQGDLTYKWSLPEDVQVVEGHTSDALPGVKAGQVVEVKLTVTGFNKEKQKLISLQAHAQRGDQVLGNSAVIASRPEDTWEAVAPDMKKSAEEQLSGGRPGR